MGPSLQTHVVQQSFFQIHVTVFETFFLRLGLSSSAKTIADTTWGTRAPSLPSEIKLPYKENKVSNLHLMFFFSDTTQLLLTIKQGLGHQQCFQTYSLFRKSRSLTICWSTPGGETDRKSKKKRFGVENSEKRNYSPAGLCVFIWPLYCV